jgi:GNAT superfamily N-acetyltransferase
MQSMPHEDHRPGEDRPPGEHSPRESPPGDAPPGPHPLARLITDASAGRFPAADGGWRRVPVWRPGLEGIIAFTGHAVLTVAPDIASERLVDLGVDGFGGAHDPRLITALAGPDGWIDSLDVLMTGRGTGSAGGSGTGPGGSPGDLADRRAGGADNRARLVDRPDLATHHRALFAARIRDRFRILGYPDPRRSALAIVSTGLAGLTELSFELEPERRGAGRGAALIRDALTAIPAGRLVVAAIAPGNAASLRAALTAGFSPVGSMQLFRRAV